MDVMTWFYEQRHNLFPLMDEWMRPGQGLGNDEEKKNEFKASPKIPKVQFKVFATAYRSSHQVAVKNIKDRLLWLEADFVKRPYFWHLY